MKELESKKGFICDMDGVIYHGSTLLPGAKEFVDWLMKENKDFLFLTNNSSKTRKELQVTLQNMGITFLKSIFIHQHSPQQAFCASNAQAAPLMLSATPDLPTPCTT